MSQNPIDYLAGAYFHQDYDLEAPSPDLVLVNFRDVESAGTVTETMTALSEALSSGSEEALADLWLRRAGASYDPRSDGVSMTDWFSRMVDVLAAGASS